MKFAGAFFYDQKKRGRILAKKGDSPKPAYAATSEQWTKFTGLRASPHFKKVSL
jgi:hypothetical protein